MLNWIVTNWIFSIPICAFVAYLVCYGIEQAVYAGLGIPAAKAPHKRRFPRTILFLEALAVFFFMMWFNCGMIFWEKGWRPALLVLFFVFLAVLAAVWVRTLRRLTRRSPKWGRGYPTPAALCFCLRRTVGSFVPGWFLGLIPAGIYQSISLSGVEGTARSLTAQVLPGLLPVLFLLAVWLIGNNDEKAIRAAANGTYDPRKEPEKKERTLFDITYEAQMANLIEQAIQQEEEENERRYREYWEGKG